MEIPKRKLQRLPGFDYASQRYYFVTLCCANKAPLFGKCKSPSNIGKTAAAHIDKIPAHFDGVRIDKSVVMPNHIHMIVVIGCDKAERSRPFPTLSTIVGLYKSGVAREIHKTEPELKIWQKSFHDHIIRNDSDYLRIWQYIDANPATWENDCFYCEQA